jgi:type IV pilus assembly protein PilN
MSDYNFFNDLSLKKEKKSAGFVVTLLFCILLLTGMAGLYGYNYYIRTYLEVDLVKTNTAIAEIKASEDLGRILHKKDILDNLESILSNIEVANTTIYNRHLVQENIFAMISDTLPMDVELVSIEMADGVITMEGYALNKPAIAEFEHNLRQMTSVSDLFLSGIVNNESNYGFTIQVQVGGGLHENI